MLEESNGVVVVPVDEAGNVYLEKEYFVGANRMMLGLVGGKTFALKDADLKEEAQRELQEEIGMKAKKLIKLNKSYVTPWTSNRVAALFLGLGLEPAKRKTGDHDEIIEVVKMPINEAIREAQKDFVTAGHEVGYLMLAREKLRELGILNER